MSARQKLNAAYLGGSLVVAGMLGLLSQSATVFLIAAGVLITLNLLAGDIRGTRQK